MKLSVLWIGCVAACSAVSSQAAPVQFTIDRTRDAKPISRYIYGVNQKLDGAFADLPFTRVGGNRWTAYNWTNNASNAGNDYIYQNDFFLGGGNTPGGAVIASIQNASSRHAGIVITIPINGYVSADGNGGGDVHKSGPNYLQTRFHPEVPQKGAPFTLTPDPAGNKVFQDEFVNWVRTEFPYGQTDAERPIFFSMDNEPDLWPSTHKEVHPNPTTYAELVEKTIEYSTAVKRVEPKAKIFGPVNYGWQGYINLQNAPDAKGRDFQDFYLAQLAQAEKTGGKRLLDVFDVHWYPEAQGGGKRISGPETTDAVVAARLQAPRSLWDPTYTEQSWITQWSTKGPINLLPRLFKKIATNYPGTQLSITEYSYGGGGHISGGIAEADVLGIFGREGLFAAAEWPLAGNETFIAGGLLMFRDFDGRHSSFGDTSVSALTNESADTSVYASADSADPKRMVLVAINKTKSPVPASIAIEHYGTKATGKVYELTGTSAVPKATGVIVINPTAFNILLPAYSVSTIELVLAK